MQQTSSVVPGREEGNEREYMQPRTRKQRALTSQREGSLLHHNPFLKPGTLVQRVSGFGSTGYS